MTSSGYFITFEGTEGAGKSTQVRAAEAFLKTRGFDPVVIREPGGTELGDRIRTILLSPSKEPLTPLAELFLFSASRHQLVETVIRPALSAGKVVLCDRFFDSSLAYQGFGRGVSLDIVHQLNVIATGGLEPDLTVVLDLLPELGLSRVKRRHGGVPDDRFETESLAFHQRIRQGFLKLAEQNPHRMAIVGAARPVEQVSAEIFELIDNGIQRRPGTRSS